MNRKIRFSRKTKETEITIALDLDGKGDSDVQTPIGFFNHMMESFVKHGMFNLKLDAGGDLHVDQHHLLEDCGIVVGQAFRRALGEARGINRTGFFVFPMDESLAIVAVDIGGRPFLQFKASFKRRLCGEMDTDILEDFFYAFSVHLGANIVIRVPEGRSDHHKLEAVFKAFGKALRMACSKDSRDIENIPSLKGVIDRDWDR